MATSGDTNRYDLFVAHGAGPSMRFTDEGFAVGPEAISYTRRGIWITRPFIDIVSVNLSSSTMARFGRIGHCTIRFCDNTKVFISTANSWGALDHKRNERFVALVRDLHRRLSASGRAKAISFSSGVGARRSAAMTAALIASAALFVVLPIVLFVMTGQAKALFLSLGGAVFLWPTFRMAKSNRPGTYRPENPPNLLS